MGKDHTLYALTEGYIRFYRESEQAKRKLVGVVFDRWINYLLNMFHYYTTNACVFVYLIYLYFHIKKSAPFTKT